MRHLRLRNVYLPGLALCVLVFCGGIKRAGGWQPLFDEPGPPPGWSVRAWDDVSMPAANGAAWLVDEDGVLHGSDPRGTWLVSDQSYGNFIIEFEWKLGDRGNSGFGLRFPDAGDPAFAGLEIQMCDPRYNEGRDGEDKLTASIYNAIAPTRQVYKPEQWNRYVISARGSHITVKLNGKKVQDVRLDQYKDAIARHDGTPAPALKDRPPKGHIGFQELSRGGGHVMIRNVRLKVFD